MSYIGMKVRKKFNDGKMYDGTVEKCDKRKKWFLINYDDMDVEDVNLNELKKISIYTKERPKNKTTTEIRKI